MFRAEHEEALRHQIRSLERVQLSDVDAFGQEFNQVVKDQRALLEEIRIEIHNQIRDANLGASMAQVEVERAQREAEIELERQARRNNGILV